MATCFLPSLPHSLLPQEADETSIRIPVKQLLDEDYQRQCRLTSSAQLQRALREVRHQQVRASLLLSLPAPMEF